jgi:glycosyltransferase involved in cell wall biosynthesis
MKPLISVIMPVYNCEKTLNKAVDSVLKQTYPNLELIIVNDNSRDNTKDIVEEIVRKNPKIKLVNAPDDIERFDKKTGRNINAGWSARNEGFKHSKGEFITFQDADDVSLLNRIEIQYELLCKNNAAHVVIDWIKFNEEYVDQQFNFDSYKSSAENIKLTPEEIRNLNKKIPFHIKRMGFINKLFFGSLDSYPGIPGIALFRREVMEKIKFRKLKDREWPSFMGRGVDRDFNFKVAEEFKNSYAFLVPLYMWRVPTENNRYPNGIKCFLK